MASAVPSHTECRAKAQGEGKQRAAVRERLKDNGGQQVDCSQPDLSRPLKLLEICCYRQQSDVLSLLL